MNTFISRDGDSDSVGDVNVPLAAALCLFRSSSTIGRFVREARWCFVVTAFGFV